MINTSLQHGLTHAPKIFECYGCDGRFVSDSAMLLHLESGFCACRIEADQIERLAFECHQAGYYTNEDFVWVYDYHPFRCPTCDDQFDRMSALLQHVESDRCDEALTSYSPLGKFLRFLKTRV